MTKSRTIRLGDLARQLQATLEGDADLEITGISTLQNAKAGDLSFLANPAYAKYVAETRASAIIVAENFAETTDASLLKMKNPYLGYARVSHLFDPAPAGSGNIHSSAVVDESASLANGVSVGPNAVISAHASIGEGAVIGAGVFVGEGSMIGARTRLHANATLYHGVTVGDDCIIHSGAVIGSDGFGFAPEAGQWNKIAQIGGVVIGNQVEIGANVAIDRGALDDTRIADGVKLDNLIQIAHNVSIGEHSAMAAMVGIAGSTSIGKHCIFGGASGVGGHLEIGDHVHLTGMTMVTRSLSEPGVYSSGTGVEPNAKWRKSVVRFRQLDDMARRLKQLEKKSD